MQPDHPVESAARSSGTPHDSTNVESAAHPLYVSARWAAGIAKVEVRHDPRGGASRAVFLRLTLDEAKKLRDDLETVIEERQPDPDEPRVDDLERWQRP